MTNISNPFLKACLPLAAILLVLLISKFKLKLSLKRDLNLCVPKTKSLLLWLGFSMVWMLATDYLMNWRGAWDFVIWHNQPLHVSTLRILAVVLAGPIAEELIFRGLIMYKVSNLNIMPGWLVVTLIAAAWAAIHVAYSIPVICIIFIFGLLLGFAKLKSQ